MSELEPKQLSFDDLDDSGIELVGSGDSGRYEDDEDDELDRYVNQNGCSYDEARRHFGLVSDEVAPTKTVTDLVGSERPISGIAVNLHTRASRLIDAIDHLSKASQADGRARAIEVNRNGIRGRFNDDDMARAIEQRDSRQISANSELARAFGYKALLDAGYDAVEVGGYLQEELEDFRLRHTGSGENAKARSKLKKKLQKRFM